MTTSTERAPSQLHKVNILEISSTGCSTATGSFIGPTEASTEAITAGGSRTATVSFSIHQTTQYVGVFGVVGYCKATGSTCSRGGLWTGWFGRRVASLVWSDGDSCVFSEYNLNGGGQVDRAAQVLQVSRGKGSPHPLQSGQRAALLRIECAVNAGTGDHLRWHTRAVFWRAVAFQGGRGAASDKIHLHRRLRGQGVQLSRNNRASLLLQDQVPQGDTALAGKPRVTADHHCLWFLRWDHQEVRLLDPVEILQWGFRLPAFGGASRQSHSLHPRRPLSWNQDHRPDADHWPQDGDSALRYLFFYLGSFCDLMWSDPENIEAWAPNNRGAGWIFGTKVVRDFNHINGLELIARAHQLVQ